MSYQSIETGATERFFTVIDKTVGDPITVGVVNYYLKAKSGDNNGKWWRDADQTWQISEIANPMVHDADGHWEIDLNQSSPFIVGIRFLEYVKESGNLHVPDSRHVIARNELVQLVQLVQADNASIAQILTIVHALNCVDTDAIINSLNEALKNTVIQPERTVLGPCKVKVKKLDLC